MTIPSFGSRVSLAAEEVEDFEEEIRQQREASIRVKEQMTNEFEEEKKKLRRRIDALDEELKEAKSAVNVAGHDAVDRERQERDLRDRVELLERERGHLLAQIDDLTARLKSGEDHEDEELTRALADNDRLETMMEQQRERLQSLEVEKARTLERIVELERELKLRDEEVKDLKKTSERVVDLERELQLRDEEVKDLKTTVSSPRIGQGEGSSESQRRLKVLEERAEGLHKQLLAQKVDFTVKEKTFLDKIQMLELELKERKENEEKLEEMKLSKEKEAEAVESEKDRLQQEVERLSEQLRETASKQSANNNAAMIELKSANKEMARKLSEVQQQLEVSKVTLKEERNKNMKDMIENNERVSAKEMAIERLNEDKEALEKQSKESAMKIQNLREQIEEAEEKIEEYEKKMSTVKDFDKDKDDRHERLMSKLKELEQKNLELLETAKKAEMHKQVDSVDGIVVKRLEDKNQEYRKKWKEEEDKSDELERTLKNYESQLAELKRDKSCGDGRANSAKVQDLRRDLLSMSRDLCCKVLDDFVERCETAAGVGASKSKEETPDKAEEPLELKADDVANGSIILREDKILDLIHKLSRESKKAKEESNERRKRLEEEESKREHRDREIQALKSEVDFARRKKTEMEEKMWQKEEEIVRLRKEIATMERDVDIKAKQVRAGESMLLDVKEELEKCDGQLLELKERELTRMERERAEMEEELAEERRAALRMREEKRKMEERLEREKTEMMEEEERLKEELHEAEKQKRRLEEKLKSVEDRVRSGKEQEIERKGELEKKIFLLEKELEEIKRGSLRIKDSLDGLALEKEDSETRHAREVEGLCFQLKKANDRVRDMTKELEDAESRNFDGEGAFEEKMESLKRLSEQKNVELRRAERQLRKLESEAEDGRLEKSRLQQKMEENDAEKEKMRKERDNLAGRCQRFEAKLGDARRHIEELRAIRVKPGPTYGRRGPRAAESMSSLDEASVASVSDSFHAGVVQAAMRFELEAKKEECIQFNAALEQEKMARRAETQAKDGVVAQLRDARDRDVKQQREINACRHALLDVEAKLEAVKQEAAAASKDAKAAETKLQAAEATLKAKCEEIAMLQMALTKAAGKRNAIQTKFRQWKRNSRNQLQVGRF